MVSSDPLVLQTICDALGQAGISGGGRFGAGLVAGALDQVPQAGSLMLTGSVLRSVPVAVRVYRDSAQSIANATADYISFSAAENDAFGMWKASAPTTLTAYASGLYVMQGMIAFDANVNGYRTLEIEVPDGVLIGTILFGGSGNIQPMSTTALYVLGEGDGVRLRVYQNSGGALNVVVNTGINFTMARIA